MSKRRKRQFAFGMKPSFTVKRFGVILLLGLVLLVSAGARPLSARQEKSGDQRLLDLVAALKSKEQELQHRAALLDEKEQRLNLLQKELKKQEQELAASRRRMEQLIADYKALKDEDLSRLVAVYSAMKPAAAAPLLEKLDLKYAVEVILRMPTKKAAKLLSAVEAGKAAEISKAITGLPPVK